MRKKREILEEIAKAEAVIAETGGDTTRAFEEGVKMALDWVLGQTDDIE